MHAVDPGEHGLVGRVLAHGSQHVETADVLGALPYRMAVGVSDLTRQTPVLAVAVAAEELDRLRRGVDPEPAEPHLGGRHQDSPEAK